MTIIIDRTRDRSTRTGAVSVAEKQREKTRPTGLYKARVPIYPKLVNGRWRWIKWALLIVMLAIYYITPWIRWDRGPHAPDQAILVDLANRRFYFFFLEIWPQEFYYVAGLLIMAGMGMSPYVRMDAALFATVGYLLLSIHAYLGARVLGDAPKPVWRPRWAR